MITTSPYITASSLRGLQSISIRAVCLLTCLAITVGCESPAQKAAEIAQLNHRHETEMAQAQATAWATVTDAQNDARFARAAQAEADRRAAEYASEIERLKDEESLRAATQAGFEMGRRSQGVETIWDVVSKAAVLGNGILLGVGLIIFAWMRRNRPGVQGTPPVHDDRMMIAIERILDRLEAVEAKCLPGRDV